MNIGIFSLSCCEGCSVEFLNMEEEILDILNHLGIENFRLVKEVNKLPVDVAFVEGVPANENEIAKLLEIRRNSRILVALGSCSATGGVLAPGAKPIGHYVDVDHCLYGCPFSRDELKEFLTSIIIDKAFRKKEYSVCMECSLLENGCLLEEGYLCMGPITVAGCNALCPSNGKPCLGCRGSYEDANLKSHAKILLDKGFSKDEIIDAFSLFSHRDLREVIEWLKGR